jgi:hypothetical protein
VVEGAYCTAGGEHSNSSLGDENFDHVPGHHDSQRGSADDWALTPYLSQPQCYASVHPYSPHRSSHNVRSRRDGSTSIETRLRENRTQFEAKDAELVKRLTALHQER